MEYKNDIIKLDKKLSELDRKVVNFHKVIKDIELECVFVSGYVAILFGRSRGTEDIDVIIEESGVEETEEFVERLKQAGYWCINSSEEDVYEMLKDGIAVRFAEEDEVIPNFEVRFAEDEFEKKALEERLKVKIGSDIIYISPFELQIAYKLYLGSENDFEDALHLYEIFEDELNFKKLEEYCKILDVRDKLNELRET